MRKKLKEELHNAEKSINKVGVEAILNEMDAKRRGKQEYAERFARYHEKTMAEREEDK